MGAFAAGQVVILPFPFSDLTERKYRPALVLAAAGRGDWILCHITSNAYGDRRARVRANEAESRTLAQTRDLLLSKLMSGDIRLRDAERAVEAVL
jgi:hypothetical protein